MKPKKLHIFALFFSVLCWLILADPANVKAEQYSIVVNKGTCVTTVYKSDGTPYKAFVCSPGKNTPEGTFQTNQKLRWHELIGNVYGQYCTRIVEQILFHSVYYYTNGDPSTVCTREYNYLGVQRSLGCIRLTVEDCKWIYDNCSLGTTVTIMTGTSKDDPLGKPTSQRIDSSVREGWDPTDPDPNNPYAQYLPTIKIKKSKKTTYQRGAKINYLDGVTAKDYNGKDITSELKVEGSVNNQTMGEQTVTFYVKGSEGLTAYKQFTFKMIDTKKPTLTGTKNKSVEYKTTVNAKKGVKAKSSNGKSVTKKIKISVVSPSGKKVSVKKGKFKASEIGAYKVTYKVTGYNKKTKKKTVTFTSVDKRVKLSQKITEVEYGTNFNPYSAVTLKNFKGKNMNVKANTTISGSVNTKAVGTYKVTYTATQSKKSSRKVKITYTFQVVNKKAPVITVSGITNSNTIELAKSDVAGSVYNLMNGVTAQSATGVNLIANVTVSKKIISTEDNDATTDSATTNIAGTGSSVPADADTNTATGSVSDSEIDLTKSGTYEVTYTVTVPVTNGLSVSKTVTYIVK